MKAIESKHLLAVYHLIRKDLKRISFFITIIVQLFLLVYYSFSIYSHRNEPVYTIIYSTLFALSLFLFLEECLYQRKQKNKEEEDEGKENHKKIRKILKILSMAGKICLLITSAIPIIQNKATDFEKVMTLALLILLVIQFSLMFLLKLLSKYLKWIKTAYELDKKESWLKSPTQTYTDKLHAFALKAKKQEEESLTEQEETEIQQQLSIQIQQDQEKKKVEKQEKAQSNRNQRKEDTRLLLNNIFNKFMPKKNSDRKLQIRYEEEKEFAEKCLTNPDLYQEFLLQVRKLSKNNEIPQSLDYLSEFVANLSNNKKLLDPAKIKEYIINIHYYLNPLIDNSESVSDNLEIKKKAEEDRKNENTSKALTFQEKSL